MVLRKHEIAAGAELGLAGLFLPLPSDFLQVYPFLTFPIIQGMCPTGENGQEFMKFFQLLEFIA